MTALAPRRRPIFGRKTEMGPALRRLLLVAAVVAIAAASFAAGVNYGAHAEAKPGAGGAFAAVLHD